MQSTTIPLSTLQTSLLDKKVSKKVENLTTLLYNIGAFHGGFIQFRDFGDFFKKTLKKRLTI